MSQKIVAIIFPGVTSTFNIFFTGNVEYFNTTDSISVSGPLNMEPIGCPEMSITSYQSMLCNIPEEQRSHLHRTGSMKSHTMTNVFHVDRWPILSLSVTITRPFGKSQHHFCTWWIDMTLAPYMATSCLSMFKGSMFYAHRNWITSLVQSFSKVAIFQQWQCYFSALLKVPAS